MSELSKQVESLEERLSEATRDVYEGHKNCERLTKGNLELGERTRKAEAVCLDQENTIRELRQALGKRKVELQDKVDYIFHHQKETRGIKAELRELNSCVDERDGEVEDLQEELRVAKEHNIDSAIKYLIELKESK